MDSVAEGQRVAVRLLGPVEVIGSDGPRDLDGPRPTRILLALFTAEHHRLSLDALADRCFDDNDRPTDPTPALRTAVRRVRRALGDGAVRTVTGGYELAPSQIDLDIDRFEEYVAAGRAATDPVAAVTQFGRALDLWRGEPFDGHDAEWLDLERGRLEELHLVALEGWHEGHLRNGTVTEILPSLERTAAGHPLRERFWRQLMHGLYLADRQSDALRAFQKHREALIGAGLEPSAETVELEQRIARSDKGLLVADAGRPLRGYRINERLGEGAFSIVYRGVQPSVDRDVAIKQIRAELANRPEFIRRFETEAHLVARLEHPYIVPLYDYWREPGSAYLIMRYLRGGTLEGRLLDGALSVRATCRLVDQVGSALAAAHRAGVVHRDVKPANILLDGNLDEDGNAYLTDFGIALEAAELLDPESSLSAGSPAYASPEQLQRMPVGPTADVHGLGIAVYEALTGRLPFPDEPDQAALLQRQLKDPIPLVRSSRNDVPPAVDQVLQRATAKNHQERFQTIDEFVAAFRAVFDDRASGLGGSPGTNMAPGGVTMMSAETRNPFKGLRAFTEADAGDFAGRSRLVDQLVHAIDNQRLVAVVGPSGSGKSSVVRAGLLPALRNGRIPGAEQWFVATMVPGARPFEELEEALVRIAVEQPPSLLEILRDGDRGISRALRRIVPEDAELLLVIDQFEELFTLCDDADERRQFLDALSAAVAEDRSRLRVIATLRADFYDRPLRYESIGRLVRDATVPVLPLAADELERAIVDPARSVGCDFEPGLVSEIVADVADQPGALPMLQYALTELYERRVSGLLTRTSYHELGGVAGALAARAEELFLESPPDTQGEIRRIFGRLVTLGEGTEDTRRRVVRSELGAAQAVDDVVAEFGEARLLSFDRDPASREPTIEVAHEALIREWPRLREWLEDDRDGLRVLRHLTESAAAWEAANRDTGELYRGGRLEAAEAWAADHGGDLTDAEAEFLGASIEARDATVAAVLEQREAERRSNQRLRRLLTGVAMLAAVAMIAGVVAFQQRGAAQDAAFAAETGRLVATSESLASSNSRAAMLVAVAAYQREQTSATLGALQRALSTAGPLLGHVRWGGEPYFDVEWLADDLLLAATPDRLELIDVPSGEAIDVYEVDLLFGATPGRDLGQLIAASADGHRIVVAAATPSLRLLDVVDGEFSDVAEVALAAPAIHVAISPSGDTAVGSTAMVEASGEIQLIAVDHSGLVLFDKRLSDHANYLQQALNYLDEVPFADSFEGRPLAGGAVAVDDIEVVWGYGSELLRLDLAGEETGPRTMVVAAGLPAQARELTLAADEVVVVSNSVVAQISRREAVGGRFDGAYIEEATGGGSPGLLRGVRNGDVMTVLVTSGALWTIDAGTGETVGQVDLGLGSGYDIAALEDVVAIAHGQGISLVSLSGRNPLSPVSFPRDVIQTHLSTSLSGDWVSLGLPGFPGPIALWHRGEEGWAEVETDVLDGDASWAAVDDDSDELFTTLESQPPIARYYRLPDVEMFQEHDGWREGELGASAGDLAVEADLETFGMYPVGMIVVRSLSTGEVVVEVPTPSGDGVGMVTAAVLSPDHSKLLVALETGEAELWDTGTWERIEVDELIAADIALGRWSADGGLVATASSQGQITVRDGVTFEPVIEMVGAVGLANAWGNGSIRFSPDNTQLLSNFDGPARLWDVASGEQIGTAFPTEGQSSAISADDDGFNLVTAVPGSALVWDMDMGAWAGQACRSAGADLSEEEWTQWGPRDEDFRPLC